MNQTAIIADLGIAATFDAPAEADRRILFLKDYLRNSGLAAYVLGISGGIDSTTAALLAQAAVRQLRDEGYAAEFIAVRLPYRQQADEHDAQAALAAIAPDRCLTVNIHDPVDAMMRQVEVAGVAFASPALRDFHLGNIKARQRMVAQYAVAGSANGLVIGTDHAAEAVMGFFTKFGDGAADILPLAGLTKRRVRALARHMGAPEALITKVPTADLEDHAPQRADEEVYGVTYDQIDDFLEGKQIDQTAEEIIIGAYRRTAHKRSQPVAANA